MGRDRNIGKRQKHWEETETLGKDRDNRDIQGKAIRKRQRQEEEAETLGRDRDNRERQR